MIKKMPLGEGVSDNWHNLNAPYLTLILKWALLCLSVNFNFPFLDFVSAFKRMFPIDSPLQHRPEIKIEEDDDHHSKDHSNNKWYSKGGSGVDTVWKRHQL